MTYADDFDLRDKDLCTINGIANAVDGLLTSTSEDFSAGGQTISSTSYALMTGMSRAVTVAEGETVRLDLQCGLQIATAGDSAYIQLRRDAVALREIQLPESAGNTWHWVNGFAIDRVPAAGTYTYTAYIKNNTGARNIITYNRNMIITKIQES